MSGLATSAKCLHEFVSNGSLMVQNGFPCGNWNDQGVGILHLRPFNVTSNGQIDLDKKKFIETDKKLDNYLLQSGDVIFNNTNSEELVGKTGYWTLQERSVLSNHMTILRVLDTAQLNSHFLAFYLLQKWHDGHFNSICQRHVNQASVGKDRLGATTLPPIGVSKQKKIAHVLSTVQCAIEAQEKIIQTTTELKKALMQKFFTEGLRGELQKETEIGPVPESWEVVPLEGKTDSFVYGTSVKCNYEAGGHPVLRIPNVIGGKMDIDDMKYGQPKPNEIDKLKLAVGDLLFVRTNGVKENAGRCSIFNGELDGCYFASYLIRVRLDPKVLNPEFLSEYSRTDAGISMLSGRSVRTADGKFNINAGTLKTMLIPVPGIDEQKEISDSLAIVEQKIAITKQKKVCLESLFKTLLHELMAAKTRVHTLELKT